MSRRYEEAPAVDLVATSCCVCGRPLLDAPSLKAGIGPVCAEKTGYGRAELPAGVRDEVNRLVYELAAYGRDVRAIERLGRLRELGFGELVKRVEERLHSMVEIRTGLVPDCVPARVWVEFPKLERKEAFDALLADVRCIPGRRWVRNGASGWNTFPRTPEAFDAFMGMLAKHFPGRVVQGLKGLYVVYPASEGQQPEDVTY